MSSKKNTNKNTNKRLQLHDALSMCVFRPPPPAPDHYRKVLGKRNNEASFLYDDGAKC